MGHIFISYSHKDTEYAHRLAENLQSMGFNVWIDARLDYGSQWPLEIQKQLDSCDAFIVIMTPRAFASEWVQSELQRAKRKLKPIFPLLLEGEEPWLSVEATQFYDVRSGKFPDEKFYSAIRRSVTANHDDATLHYVKSPAVTVKPSQPAPKKKGMSTEIVVALIGGAVTLIAACVTIIGGPLVEKWLNSSRVSTSVPVETRVVTLETTVPSLELSPATGLTITPSIFSDANNTPMALVPAGEFIMGSDSGDGDEKPIHKVELKAFYIDVYEVTKKDYFSCVASQACQLPVGSGVSYDPSEAEYPVGMVTWDMAKAYCEWRDARLPTEAEWEKAARGTDGRTYPWGEAEPSCSLVNYGDCVHGPVPVGSYPNGISPYGIYDMSGNVFEWVNDYYSDVYYAISPAQDPQGPTNGEYRVIRGGSYDYEPYKIRTTLRFGEPPDSTAYGRGFRCAKDATQ
ncbi:MAG: SUMF1/EgtB/PvdO family nonheme iron enzyme [Anaerolineales bacterium]